MSKNLYVLYPVFNAAMRREVVNGVNHFVFDYRERAATAHANPLGTDTMKLDDAERLNWRMDASPRIPDNIRQQAEPHARRLTAVLSRLKPVLRRDRAHGSLDSSKLARLASPGISAREFETMASRAYRLREPESRQRAIKIGIVGDFNFSIRSRDKAYAPRLATLIQTLTEACALAGTQCAAYGTRGGLGLQVAPEGRDGIADRARAYYAGPRMDCSATAVLKDYGDEMNGQTFALLTDESAFITAYCSTGFGTGSENGNGGIDFARAKGADFVIGIGDFPSDGKRADVLLPASTGLDEAVNRIAAKLEAYMEGTDLVA